MLNWGVYPIVTKKYTSTDEIVNDAILKAKGFINLEENDIILITGGFNNNAKFNSTDFIKIEQI